MRVTSMLRLPIAALLLLGTALASAQTFPAKPIRLVVPYLTGGLPDVLARMVAQKMATNVGQQVIVENRAGASGIVAAELVVRAEPDGYTLFVGDIGHYAVNPALYPKLPYAPLRDFAPVTQAVTGPLFLVVNPELGVNTIEDFVSLARTRPGINYGTPGNASTHHLGTSHFANVAGIRLVHVPYKSNAQAVPGLLSNDVSMMFVALPSVLPHVRAGKLRILATGSAERSPLMPEVPGMREKGFANVDIVTNIGFFAPAATPKPVLARLNAEIVAALRSPEIEPKMPGLGATVVAGTPEQFTERIRTDQAMYAALIRQVDIKVE